MSGRGGLVCLMGSGETSPGMVSVHADLIGRVGAVRAVILDTSYGFQENADEISARLKSFFERRVRIRTEVASLGELDKTEPLTRGLAYSKLRSAGYVFAGPGSPSYVVRQWKQSPVAQLLADCVSQGGCLTFASAAAIALGRFALPVYEIYKVGEAPRWIEGLDLLRPLGLDFVVVPHYDNTDGRTHDTRFCYIGERRFLELERQLEPGMSILGLAEQTAAIFDLAAQTMEVRGRGFVAIRRQGIERRFPADTTVKLEEIAIGQRLDARASGEANGHGAEAHLADLAEVLPRLVDRNQLVEPLIELAVQLRDQARSQQRYAEADVIRKRLLEIGIELRDSSSGTVWVRSARQPSRSARLPSASRLP